MPQFSFERSRHLREAKLTIYQKPTCTTCRRVMMILKENGVDFEAINYYIDPIPKKKLKELLTKMKLSAKDILRRQEPICMELKLGERDLSEDELIDLMVKYPDLIQRPIIEKGDKAVLARPAERVREILPAFSVFPVFRSSSRI